MSLSPYKHFFFFNCKVIVITTVWYWHKNRNIDKWNQIERAEKTVHIYRHLVFDKGGKNIQLRQSLFNKWHWQNWSTMFKRMKLEHFLTPYTKISSKLMKDLKIRPEIIILSEENIGSTLKKFMKQNQKHFKCFIS